MKNFEEFINEQQEVKSEDLPIDAKIGKDEYTMKIVNDDEFTLFKNGEQIYATSDSVGSYALAEMFIEMMGSWSKIEEERGGENPGDLIDKIVFEVLAQHYIKAGTVINDEDKEKLKDISKSITGREWNVRKV